MPQLQIGKMKKELTTDIGMQGKPQEASLYELQTTVERYPFDQSARVNYIGKLFSLRNEAFGRELRKASLFVPDRKVLFYMVEGERYKITPQEDAGLKKSENVKGIEHDADRTATLINEFLLEMPDDQPKRRLTLADATTDYAAYIEQQENLANDPQANTKTLSSKKNIGKKDLPEASFQLAGNESLEEPPLPDGEKDLCFTETLAKIYIKQGKYEGAIEIMRKLNADNPKKSCYFADQIRFLEKVVINNKNKK